MPTEPRMQAYTDLKERWNIPRLGNLTYSQRREIHRKMLEINRAVPASDRPHYLSHIYYFMDAILSVPIGFEGCIVEAGCFKGISSARFSHIAKLTRRRFVIFDSFEGLPENDEKHEKSIMGHSIEGWFTKGKYAGSLEEVKRNISRYGYAEPCEFRKGWLENMLPHFRLPVAAAYIDVDLASSTKTCLQNLYSLLSPGGAIVSQDGDFPLVINVFKEWLASFDPKTQSMPRIEGLGISKMVKIVKP